jgi:hypothetical protein
MPLFWKWFVPKPQKEFSMLKRLALSSFLILAAVSFAKADSIVDYIPPSTATVVSATVNNSSVTIASPGARHRNCLTGLTVNSNYNITFSVRSGNTDEFVIDISTISGVSPANSTPVVFSWPENDPLCADYNNAMNIVVSTGTSKVNYRGHIRAWK